MGGGRTRKRLDRLERLERAAGVCDPADCPAGPTCVVTTDPDGRTCGPGADGRLFDPATAPPCKLCGRPHVLNVVTEVVPEPWEEDRRGTAE